MAATTEIKRRTGASGGPTDTDITSSTSRLSTSDSPTPSSSNPIPRPSSGVVRSYWASIFLNASVAPATSITNIKFYMDGASAWTGITLYIGLTNTYTEATGTTGSFGDDSLVATTDAFTYTSGSPLTVTSNATTGTGRLSYYMVVQADVTNAASPGTQGTETASLVFDEV